MNPNISALDNMLQMQKLFVYFAGTKVSRKRNGSEEGKKRSTNIPLKIVAREGKGNIPQTRLQPT